MRLLSEADVEQLIDPQLAIASAMEAYRQHSAGLVPAPGRLDLPRANPKGSVLVLGGHSHGRLFALKSNVHAYSESASAPRKAASLLTLWDSAACVPLALIATTGFNNHRTAAGFAAAAQALAAPDARTLAVFGAGKIAPATIRYLASVRPLRHIMLVGRGGTRASALAAAARHWPDLAGVKVEAMADPAQAAALADVIVTITTADAPVFPGASVKPGTFVILGGANRAHAREADDVLIGRARVFADHLEGCLDRAGDLKIPTTSHALKPSRIAGEIGALLAGRTPPATPGTDITVFKSIGIASQDLLLAEALVMRAQQMGVGVEFDPQGAGEQR